MPSILLLRILSRSRSSLMRLSGSIISEPGDLNTSFQPRQSLSLCIQVGMSLVFISSGPQSQTRRSALLAFLCPTSIYSPWARVMVDWPSKQASALDLDSWLSLMVSLEDAGMQMGRKDRLLGAMGVRMMVSIPESTTGPPADREQAVEPVGVEMSSPSPVVWATGSESRQIYRVIGRLSLRVMASQFSRYLGAGMVLVLAQIRISLWQSNDGYSQSCLLLILTALAMTCQASASLNLHRKPSVP